MGFQKIYNMYGFAASAGLLYEKILKKFHFFCRSKLTFMVLDYQDGNCKLILFLNIEGYSLGEKLKKELKK